MSRPTILVVEDDPALRALLAVALDLEGYPVETATNGAEALQALTRVRPACILLNLNMPVLDGPGLARELAARRMAIPLIVVSAGPDGPRVAEAIRAVGFVAKPFDLDAVLALVARLVSAETRRAQAAPNSPSGAPPVTQ